MRNSRALGQALAAAFACVAEDPPRPAGDSHGLVPEVCVVGRFVRPTEIRNGWMPLERGTRLVYEGMVGWTDRGQVDEAGPKTCAVGRRGAGAKSRGTLQLTQITLDAAGLDRVRASAMARERDEYQRSPSVYGNTPPAERAPPATID